MNQPESQPQGSLAGLLRSLIYLIFGDIRAAFWATNLSLTRTPGIPSGAISKVRGERDKTEIRIGTKEPKEVVNWLYGELNIVDTKANSILQLNAIGIAVVVFLIQSAPGAIAASIMLKLVVLACVGLLTWSILTLTSISLVFWSRSKDFESRSGDAFDRINILVYLSDCRSQVLRSSAVRGLIAFLMLAAMVMALVIGR